MSMVIDRADDRRSKRRVTPDVRRVLWVRTSCDIVADTLNAGPRVSGCCGWIRVVITLCQVLLLLLLLVVMFYGWLTTLLGAIGQGKTRKNPD